MARELDFDAGRSLHRDYNKDTIIITFYQPVEEYDDVEAGMSDSYEGLDKEKEVQADESDEPVFTTL